ncbi:MAG: 50S ribosomal protein L5 [bacterium]|nr:50S ribosomal protein L5 [bacterium]
MSRLKDKYNKQVIPAMKKKFGYTSDLAVPKIIKVTLNSGTGKALNDDKYLDRVVDTLTRISGQKPVLTKAKISVSAFKVREGNTVGVKVTLRGERMNNFVDKLVNVALARVRDFQGLEKKSVGPDGNLSIGFKEHIVFPEIKSDEVEVIHGLEVAITTNAKTREEGLELLSLLGFPFKK